MHTLLQRAFLSVGIIGIASAQAITLNVTDDGAGPDSLI